AGFPGRALRRHGDRRLWDLEGKVLRPEDLALQEALRAGLWRLEPGQEGPNHGRAGAPAVAPPRRAVMGKPRPRFSKARRSSGFTLLELIVGLAIMVGVLSGAYFSVSSALQSQRMVEARADLTQTARVALALLAQDLRLACPLSADLEF